MSAHTPHARPGLLFSRHAVLVCLATALLLVHPAGTTAADTNPLAKTRISSAAEVDYPPFSFVDAAGHATGFSIELLQATLAAMQCQVTFRTGTWATVREWLTQGEVQVLPLVGHTRERETLFDFTFPYMNMHGAIVVRTGTTGIRRIRDLRGRHVAVMAGDNAEEFLRRGDRGITISTTDTFESALRQLSEGACDAVVMQRLVALRLIRECELENLTVINRPVPGFSQQFCFAVQEGDRATLALLNEGLSLVFADGTFRRLHAKWFAALELPVRRHIVVGGDYNYPPYEFLDKKGTPAGFNTDLTRAIAQALDLDVEIVLEPWSEIRKKLADHQIDVLQGMFYSPERDQTFDFTPPHTVNNCVAVVRTGEGPPPAAVADLRGRRIVVQRGDIMHDFAIENNLQDRLIAVDAQEKALRELARGLHDCALVARMTALYCIRRNGWKNLVVGSRPLISPGYCFAVPEGKKALLSQFSEGLNVIEKTGEYHRIYKKWLGVYEDRPLSTRAIVRYSAYVAVPLLLVLAIVFLWSWSLRRQVALRTEALRSSDEYRRAMIACSPVALYSIDAGGIVTSWNTSAERIFGWTAEEIIGRPLPIIPPDQQPAFDRLLRSLMDGQVFSGIEVIRQKKDGTRFAGSLSAAPIHDANGNRIGLMGSIEDITDRKAAEQALQESEQRFRLLVESSPDAIFVQADMRFAYLNQAAAHLFGAGAPNDLVGTPVMDRIHSDFRNEVRERISLLQENKIAAPYLEEIYLRLDGTPVTVEVSAVPINYAGSEGALVFVRDISERLEREKAHRDLQDRLTQAQKMESVGRLAGGVAHDYNNMLSVITGYAEMAMEKTSPDTPLYTDLEEILAAARRSSDITHQLLAFARQQTVNPRVLDLNKSVERTLKMLRRLIGEDIDLSWRPGPADYPVKIDPSQLDQILANLCVNSRDAIAGTGSIIIETGIVTFDRDYCADHAGFVPGTFVRLVVSDNGPGMDRETLDKAFEPFFTTKGVGRGTGLGLATVYGIVKQNNGFINIYSEPAGGTSVKIYLPRHTTREAGTATERVPEALPLRSETVLLVEDETAILNLYTKMLTGLGCTVLAANSPAQALAVAADHTGTIDLLLTDVVMPQMNGRELAERLRTLHPGLRVLFMSGYTADVIADRGVLEAGMNFISKPFSRLELAAGIRRVLDQPASGGNTEL